MMLTPFPAIHRPSIHITPDQVQAVLHGFFTVLVWIAAIAVTAYRLARIAAIKLQPHAAALLSAIADYLVDTSTLEIVGQPAALPKTSPIPVASAAAPRRSRSKQPARRA